MPQFVAMVILWVVALIPAMFYLFLFRAFRPVLAGRRKEIRSIMSRGGTFKEYLRTFGSFADQDCEKTLDGLFFQTFGRTKYYFPLAILALMSLMAMVIVLTRAGFDLGMPDLLSNRIHPLGLNVIAGLGGAFIARYPGANPDRADMTTTRTGGSASSGRSAQKPGRKSAGGATIAVQAND